MHALLIHSSHTNLPESGFLSLYSVVFAMHTCMHCWYIHFILNTLIQGFHHHSLLHLQACMHDCWYIQRTPYYQKQSFCHNIPLCLQCIYVCIADTFTSHQIPWFRVFVMITLLCLQSMHACIADTFNSHQITWNRVFVIIFRCVCNAYMCALLIHSLYTKYPDSGFLSLYCVTFAKHACMHYWYIQLAPIYLNQGFCNYIPLCLQCIHACIADTFTLY